MLDFLTRTVRAAVDVATLPLSAAVDVVTLGGAPTVIRFSDWCVPT